MNEQDKKSPQPQRRSHRMTAIYLVLLIVGILSAWQIHILINSGGDKTTDLPAPERSWSPRILASRALARRACLLRWEP